MNEDEGNVIRCLLNAFLFMVLLFDLIGAIYWLYWRLH